MGTVHQHGRGHSRDPVAGGGSLLAALPGGRGGSLRRPGQRGPGARRLRGPGRAQAEPDPHRETLHGQPVPPGRGHQLRGPAVRRARLPAGNRRLPRADPPVHRSQPQQGRPLVRGGSGHERRRDDAGARPAVPGLGAGAFLSQAPQMDLFRRANPRPVRRDRRRAGHVRSGERDPPAYPGAGDGGRGGHPARVRTGPEKPGADPAEQPAGQHHPDRERRGHRPGCAGPALPGQPGGGADAGHFQPAGPGAAGRPGGPGGRRLARSAGPRPGIHRPGTGSQDRSRRHALPGQRQADPGRGGDDPGGGAVREPAPQDQGAGQPLQRRPGHLPVRGHPGGRAGPCSGPSSWDGRPPATTATSC